MVTHTFYYIRIIPAYAGSTNLLRGNVGGAMDHPRIRGEHEDIDERYLEMTGSSPHTRGAPPNRRRHPRSLAIIPAYAGSTREAAGTGTARWDHPRIRGEHAERHDPKGNFTGSSPHTRGALPEVARRNGEVGIIPAYAGSTQCAGIRLGERSGSSPHTRGAPQARLRRGFRAGIIPAYAGSTVTPATAPGYLPDHPRIRGEHRILPPDQTLPGGSSPHTRGAPPGRPDIRPGLVDHPRIRGEHSALSQSRPGGTDHPRIRGEHLPRYLGNPRYDGSSPHTRGAPRRPRAGGR